MKVEDLLKKAIKPSVPWVERERDTEYAFWVDDERAYITFQGSKSLTDWIYNLSFLPVFGVHMGMSKKYFIIKKELERFIFNNLRKEFIFLGHSQGAGIALMGFCFMKEKYSFKGKAYLFGCPKIFSLWRFIKFKKFKEDIRQFKVKTDIVTYLSPFCFQVGKMIRLGAFKMPWKWRAKDHYPSSYKKFLNEMEV